jgi:hypothetical protein
MARSMTIKELCSILDRIEAVMSEREAGEIGEREALARNLGLIDYYRHRMYGTPLFGAK